MKFYYLLFAIIFSILSTRVHAQDELKYWCGTDEMQEKAYREHPELLLAKQQLDDFTKQWMKDHANMVNDVNGNSNKIIPVVFHILHQYGSENISDAQILDQMRIWNEDFQKRNADTVAVIPYFKSIVANCGLEFRLATKDPNGNCTNGIDRIVTTLTYGADDNAKLNYWNGSNYLNIWVCASLANSGNAAYAYYPGGAPFQKEGVMAIHTYIGSIGTGSYTKARIIGHETAHCFNLPHTWGSTNTPGLASNCGIDDGVSDTPNTIGWTGCPTDLVNSYTCNHPGIPDNIQNFMEYSYCSKMFTIGQRDQKIVPGLNSVYLSNLWSPSNLIATGTADPYTQPLCAPKADFLAARALICVGNTVKFTDISWGGHPSSWNWSFPGGTPSASPDSAPIIQYNIPGTYNVTLTSSNASGSGSFTKTKYITVLDSTPVAVPATEGFENSAFPPSGVVVLNPDNSKTWQRTTSAHSTGTASMMMSNNGNASNQIDGYITPAYNFTNMAPSLSFDRAYALWNNDQARLDVLEIYYSTNCGLTWNLRYSHSGTSLVTATPQSAGWIPNSSQWKNDTVSIYNLLKNKPNVRFKFQSVSAGGNNLYIDNINISGVFTGIEDPNNPVSSFEVYPNPAKDQINVSVTLEKASDLRIELFDITGRKVSDVANEKMANGIQNFSINQHLQDGVYLVRLTSGNTTSSKRVVVMD